MKPSPKSKGSVYFKILLVIFLLAVVLGGIWFFLKKQSGFKVLNPFGNISGNFSQDSKTVENPLTGIKYTPEESAAWKDVRPVGVMVNNHIAARPQSGLTKADVVYEMVAEGGITRYLAFFLTNASNKVGPIRSIREYYLVLVKEMGDAMIMHIGWSPQALTAIESWPVRSLIRLGLNCDNPLADPTDQNCWRNKSRVDSGVPWEHTAYGNLSLLRQRGDEAGWVGKDETFKSWKFKDDVNKYSSKPSANSVTIDFWSKGDYSSIFQYNSANNTYLRFLGYDANDKPIPHLDQETQKQIEVKNLIVEFATETSILGDEKNRLDYQLVGTGTAKIFIDGKVIEATWTKPSRDERTLFYDTDGNEITFNRGNFWVAIAPDRNKDQVVVL